MRPVRRRHHCRAPSRSAPCSTGMPPRSVVRATPRSDAGSPQTRASVDVRDRCCLKSRFSGWRRDRCAQHSSATRDGASRAWRWSEIFMLKAETAARESKELITRSAAHRSPCRPGKRRPFGAFATPEQKRQGTTRRRAYHSAEPQSCRPRRKSALGSIDGAAHATQHQQVCHGGGASPG